MAFELHTEFFPASGNARKLLIVLHGLGDSFRGFTWLPSELKNKDFAFLLANAPDPYFDGYSWFDIYENPDPGILRSRELISKLIDKQVAAGWRPGQIYLFGFSQGALMVLDQAVRSPYKFGGIVAISGFTHFLEKLPQEMSPQAKEQRILMTHGHQDPILPLPNTRSQMQILQKFGMQIDWREYNKVHTIDPGEEMQVIRDFLAQ